MNDVRNQSSELIFKIVGGPNDNALVPVRTASCSLTDNDNSPSRSSCIVHRQGSHVVLQSAAGRVRVNGQELPACCLLEVGDRIEVGNTVFEIIQLGFCESTRNKQHGGNGSEISSRINQLQANLESHAANFENVNARFDILSQQLACLLEAVNSQGRDSHNPTANSGTPSPPMCQGATEIVSPQQAAGCANSDDVTAESDSEDEIFGVDYAIADSGQVEFSGGQSLDPTFESDNDRVPEIAPTELAMDPIETGLAGDDSADLDGEELQAAEQNLLARLRRLTEHSHEPLFRSHSENDTQHACQTPAEVREEKWNSAVESVCSETVDKQADQSLERLFAKLNSSTSSEIESAVEACSSPVTSLEEKDSFDRLLADLNKQSESRLDDEAPAAERDFGKPTPAEPETNSDQQHVNENLERLFARLSHSATISEQSAPVNQPVPVAEGVFEKAVQAMSKPEPASESVSAVLARLGIGPQYQKENPPANFAGSPQLDAEVGIVPDETSISNDLAEPLTPDRDTTDKHAEDRDTTDRDNGDQDDDVNNYMNSLLSRLNSGKSNTPSHKSEVKKGVVPQKIVEVSKTANDNSPRDPLKPEEFVPSREVPEKKIDISAMRELAIESSRSAVQFSQFKRRLEQASTLIIVSASSFIGAVASFLFSKSPNDPLYYVSIALFAMTMIFSGAYFKNFLLGSKNAGTAGSKKGTGFNWKQYLSGWNQKANRNRVDQG